MARGWTRSFERPERMLQRDVLDHRFEAEEQLATGDVTVSLRVIPFGTKGGHTPEALWRVATEALDAVAEGQRRLRTNATALAGAVNTLLARHADGRWVPPRELSRPAGDPAEAAPGGERPTRAYEVEGVGTLLDERPPADDDDGA